MMTKTRNKSYLRWLLPFVVYFAIAVAILMSYKDKAYRREVLAKQTEMALAMEHETDRLDFTINEVMSNLKASANAMSFFDITHDHSQVMDILKVVVESTQATNAFVCDLSGEGYDYQGRTMSIADEFYFLEVSSEYSRSGMGMVLPNDYTKTRNDEVLVVSHASFKDGESGYVIVTLPIFPIYNKVLPEKYPAEKVSLITMEGIVLVSSDWNNSEIDSGKPHLFWDYLPHGISRDAIKLSISQKNIFMTEIKGFGYILVVPMSQANGGAVALIRYEEMKEMTAEEMKQVDILIIAILLASILLVGLVTVSHILGNRVQTRIRERKLSLVEQDPVTGLLTEYSIYKEMQKYIEEASGGKGILFIIGVEGVDQEEVDKGTIDEKRKEFARVLRSGFRSTDIIGRLGQDKFLIFLKDISEEKDVRKQMDEMQMFLHDMEVVDRGIKITPYAGAAVYPKNGTSSKELIDAASNALERAKKLGGGRLAF